MSFFLRRVGSRTDAEDLTHDVFIRLAGVVQREGVDDPDALVFKIAANLLRDRGRRGAISASAQLAEVDDHLVSALTREFLEDRTPERVLLARVEIAEVFEALGELGELTKDIYVLFRLEAMKQREIAALYGLTVKSVEKHVMRATLHLALRFGARQ
jgi:RNA polymerase sigma-70 factor (ECF subfamily)